MASKKPSDHGTGIPLHEVEALARVLLSRRYRSFSRVRKDRKSFESGKSGRKQNHSEQPRWTQSSCDAPTLFFLISFSEALSAWRSVFVPVRFGSGYDQISRRKPIIRTHLLSEKGSDYMDVVPVAGLEPARISPPHFECGTSTNSITPAFHSKIQLPMLPQRNRGDIVEGHESKRTY